MAMSQEAGTEYLCDTYKCVVSELPCPYCGDKNHQQI